MTTNPRPFERVAIVGLGLMGGSLARALKRQRRPPVINGTDLSSRSRELAGSVADRMFELSSDAVKDCDLVVYATPLQATLEILEQDRPYWKQDALVTDLVSVKAPVLERVRSLGEAARYIGSHPMAGDHRTGFEASRADLYDGSHVWLVRGDCATTACDRVADFLRQLGAQPAWSGAAEHDELMAWVSHAPQLVANALAGALVERGLSAEQMGPGGHDMTRLAGSPPALWVELLQANAARVIEAMDAVLGELTWLKDAIERGDLKGVGAHMERTRVWREGRGS